jgi:hypothetical protein
MSFRGSRLRLLARAGLLTATVVAAACQGTATQTSPIFLSDILTGTVATGAPGTNAVKTNQMSSVTLELVALDPNTGVAVGVGLGTPPNLGTGGCSVQVFQTLTVGQQFQITGVPSSTYCVSVFEFVTNGNNMIPNPLNYTVKFNHH